MVTLDRKRTKEQEKWFKTRPQVIKDMIQKIPMNGTYEMEVTRPDTYRIVSYSEDGTLKVVRFKGNSNKALLLVFGVHPENLKLLRIEDDR